MSMTGEQKLALIESFRRNEGDTGSPEVQIAVLTHRIETLTEHLKQHHKDHANRRGLLQLVSRRRRLLDYLHRVDAPKYKEIITRLGIRK